MKDRLKGRMNSNISIIQMDDVSPPVGQEVPLTIIEVIEQIGEASARKTLTARIAKR